ncbi:DUF58 domain-containing protein [Parafrankia elaeagni]|uniref:DUF58 domain-containing protein n=1 Tax=Parafrankia elaeagni TaxID=222534 RepID=UPI00035C0C26|nr:DUF58 domain-containing protein [Parafrankia elaeagni]
MSAPTVQRLPRITASAWGLLAATAAFGTAAALLHYPELVLLAGAGATALLIAAGMVVRPPRVRVELRLTTASATRGDAAALVITVVNHSRWTAPPFALYLPAAPLDPSSAADSPPPGGAVPPDGAVSPDGAALSAGPVAGPAPRPIAVDVRRLRGGASREIVLPLDTTRRGVTRIGPSWVDRRDPFGLAHRRQCLGSAVTLRVRPRAHPLVPPPTAPARDPDGQSGHGTAGGLMFHTLREYTPGEDLRLVHWAASARLGTLMVRTHVDPSEPASTVVLDTRRCAYPDGPVGAAVFEDAVDAAASAVFACARNAYSVRLVTSGGVRMTGRRRAADVDSLLDELAAIRTDGGESLDVLRTLRRGPVGTLVLVTGALGRDAMAALTPVARAFGQVIVLRMGPRSEAAARALGRRTPAGRPRLRSSAASAGRHQQAHGTRSGQSDPSGPAGHPARVGQTDWAGSPLPPVAPRAAGGGQVRVLHLATSAELRQVWPAPPALPPASWPPASWPPARAALSVVAAAPAAPAAPAAGEAVSEDPRPTGPVTVPLIPALTGARTAPAIPTPPCRAMP